jgi:hypothetical protein
MVHVLLFTQEPTYGSVSAADEVVPGPKAVDPVVDPDLDEAPDFTIAGTSAEFHYSHQIADGDGLAVLNWTHMAGTMLDFRAEPHKELPDCYDYVYLSQSFDWSYETLPEITFFSVRYSAVRTGDFNSSIGDIMFRLYAFLVDSSGNWIRIYHSYPPYTNITQQRGNYLDETGILDAFGGMIEDEFGNQEDPSDTLTLALVLAPTISFEASTAPEPWTYFNGSVEFHVTEIGITLVGPYGEDIELVSPKHNSTWSYQNESYYIHDLCLGRDDSVFLLGSMNTDFSNTMSATISRWTPSCYLTWNVSWRVEDLTGSYATSYDGIGNVYAAGMYVASAEDRGIFITKWTESGDMLWERKISSTESYSLMVSDVASEDGLVYLLYQNHTHTQQASHRAVWLQCWCDNGTALWQYELCNDYYDIGLSLEIGANGLQHILTLGRVWTVNGTDGVLWFKEGVFRGLSVDSDGSLLMIGMTPEMEALSLISLSPGGEVEWAERMPPLFEGRYTSSFFAFQLIASCPDGSIAVLSRYIWPAQARGGGYTTLDRFNSTGEHRTRRLLDVSSQGATSDICIGRNGLLYFVSSAVEPGSFNLYAYPYSDPIGSTIWNLPQMLGLAVTIVSLGVIAVVGVLWMRDRSLDKS